MFHHRPPFHHELHSLQGSDVGERVLVYTNQVRVFPCFDRANISLPASLRSFRSARPKVTGISKRNHRVPLSQVGKELDYRLIKELWAFTGNRIAVRFAYEWHDDSGHWYRSYGNENWEFNNDGLMASRFASINDLPILESDRRYYWPLGRRPEDHPGLSELGF